MRNSLGAVVGTMLMGATAVGCVPQAAPTPPPATTAPPATAAPTTAAPTTVPQNLHAPTVGAWTAGLPSGSSPVTTDLSWSVSDPDGDTLTCRLDLDGDTAFEITLSPCPSTGARTRTFTSGVATPAIEVSDGTNVSSAVTAVSVGAPAADQYSVTLRLGGTMTPTQTSAFTTAAAKWASIVKTGLGDRSLNIPADYCTDGAPAFSGTVDDLLIDAQLVTIDGPGGILGQAGPCLVRSSDGLPLYGIMQFDSADAASLESSGQFANTIIHEMGHILGIGTVWSSKGVLVGAGSGSPTFTGHAALGAWQELGGTGSVPVEGSGGPGTADAHWRETTFHTELMTGYLNSSNQLSAMTAASLADLGYGVDMAGADPYALAALRAASVHHDDDEHEHHHLETVLPLGEI